MSDEDKHQPEVDVSLDGSEYIILDVYHGWQLGLENVRISMALDDDLRIERMGETSTWVSGYRDEGEVPEVLMRFQVSREGSLQVTKHSKNDE